MSWVTAYIFTLKSHSLHQRFYLVSLSSNNRLHWNIISWIYTLTHSYHNLNLSYRYNYIFAADCFIYLFAFRMYNSVCIKLIWRNRFTCCEPSSSRIDIAVTTQQNDMVFPRYTLHSVRTRWLLEYDYSSVCGVLSLKTQAITPFQYYSVTR